MPPPPPPPPDAKDAQLQYLHCNRFLSSEFARSYSNHSTKRCGFANHGLGLASRDTTGTLSIALFVAQCSHILCSNCLESPPPPDFDGRTSMAHKCQLCQATSALVKLDSEMPDDVKKIINPFIEAIENALEVAKFQYGNATSLIRFFKASTIDELNAMKRVVKTHVENSQAQAARIKHLESELEALKRESHQLKHQIKSLSRTRSVPPQPQPETPSQPQNHQQQYFPAQAPIFKVAPPSHSQQTRQREPTPAFQQQQQQHQRMSTPFSSSNQQHQRHPPLYLPNSIQTPQSPSRLSLPPQQRPGSAMSATSSLNSSSPVKYQQTQPQYQHPRTGSSQSSNTSSSRNQFSGFQPPPPHPPPLASIPSRQRSETPIAQQQRNSVGVGRTGSRSVEMMVLDSELDDAAALQRERQRQRQVNQQQQQQQQQRPVSMANARSASVSNARADGRTVVNRAPFSSGGLSAGGGGRGGGGGFASSAGRVGTPQISKRI
ncbi:hypothetical protein HDU79_001305 [Rhizoclosmatium sp. JEL0117]|nr:hypothetical protein HDU79_001305 [Rhizoclosmatium sp. JEL0117]